MPQLLQRLEEVGRVRLRTEPEPVQGREEQQRRHQLPEVLEPLVLEDVVLLDVGEARREVLPRV